MLHFVKGMLMGMCDVIPGVSGGTIAFITGIYDRLLDALDRVDKTFFRLLRTFSFRQAWTHIHGLFLLQVCGGILLAIILFAGGVERGLNNYPVVIWSFFFGLLIASIVVIAKTLTNTTNHRLFALGGCIIGFALTSLPMTQLEPSLMSTFAVGMVAIMAMILPGISGSYLLLMMNHYRHIITVLTSIIKGVGTSLPLVIQGDLTGAWALLSSLPRDMLVVFSLGALIGLLVFAKLLHWLKTHYYQRMVALLVGIMIGALHTIWPWKETMSTFMDRHGEIIPLVQKNTLPPSFSSLALSLFVGILGASMMYGIVCLARYRKGKEYKKL